MNKVLVMTAVLSLSVSSFATIFQCGPLKFRDQMPVGGPRFEIQKSGASVVLFTVPMNPTAKTTKVNMKLVQASPELQRFSVGDLDATFIYNIHTRQTDVTLERSTNKDWSSTCEELQPKKMPKK